MTKQEELSVKNFVAIAVLVISTLVGAGILGAIKGYNTITNTLATQEVLLTGAREQLAILAGKMDRAYTKEQARLDRENYIRLYHSGRIRQ